MCSICCSARKSPRFTATSAIYAAVASAASAAAAVDKDEEESDLPWPSQPTPLSSILLSPPLSPPPSIPELEEADVEEKEPVS